MTEIVTSSTSSSVMDFFPLKEARVSQEDVIVAVDRAFLEGYKNVIVEAPVGSGKSAIAVTLGLKSKDSYVITPRKSLQNQYFEDFSSKVYLMKGRGAYPCTYYKHTSPPRIKQVINQINTTGRADLIKGEFSCAVGPCKGNSKIFTDCNDHSPCPYKKAIEVALDNEVVVHNFHSFIYQSSFAGYFEPRELLVIDECHEIKGIIRDFATVSIKIPKVASDECTSEESASYTPEEWFSLLERYKDNYSEDQVHEVAGTDPMEYTSDMDDYLESLASLSNKVSQMWISKETKSYVHSLSETPDLKDGEIRLTFVPINIGNMANSLLFSYGKKRLMMSGTIYSKALFCKNLGLKEEETCFIKVGSSFNKDNRPIILKQDIMVDTSHKCWEENYDVMIENIETVMKNFDDVKGLIHTPSYAASQRIYNSLKKTKRVVIHDKDNFQSSLEMFYQSPKPLVFLSPVCQQGVDFKDDRGRFQIILRVPYPNVSDPFTLYQMQNNFQEYNYQALITFGQQIGRVVRSEEDWGKTILLDQRFLKFLGKNKTLLQKWLTDAIIYK